MRWSWQEFEDTPKDVVDRLIELLQEEEQQREAERQKADFKRKHGIK